MNKHLWPWQSYGAALSSGLLALSLGSCAWFTMPAAIADPVTIVQSAAHQEEALAILAQAAIVYLGETHDSEADHRAQLAIIQALHQRNPQLAIGLEMFQRPAQPVLDQYLAGQITEADLVAQSEYENRWGFPWEYYAPIIRFAKANQIPLIALNTPTEVTRKVARQGLDSLDDADRRYIPPLSEIDTTNASYRRFIQAVFEGHGSQGRLNFDYFFSAQVLWDETMADRIAQFQQTNPDHQLVVLAGIGHVAYGYGIPDRVSRRLGEVVQQQIVILNPHDEITAAIAADTQPAIADMVWFSP